jgi:hypothetical protein
MIDIMIASIDSTGCETGWIFDTIVDFNLIRMLMIVIMTVRQVGFLIRMLILISYKC